MQSNVISVTETTSSNTSNSPEQIATNNVMTKEEASPIN